MIMNNFAENNIYLTILFFHLYSTIIDLGCRIFAIWGVLIIMKDIKEIYADGVETIHLLNGTVRMDLFSLQPPHQDGKPLPRVFERVIMPVQSFLAMHAAMQQIIDKMAQDGLVRASAPDKNNWKL